jgi:GR25 family glycosyltransferase involved in LPS biosynthesis
MQKFFDHIYVLNLDRRPDRWSSIQIQLVKAGITNAYRFSAIDRNPGWLGCFYSHLAILKKSFEANARNVLILEDDAALYLDWMSIWQTSTMQIPSDWDMLYLGYNFNPTASVRPPFVASHLLHLNDALTTHAYAVNGKCLEHLIKHIESQIGSNMPIDLVYSTHFNYIKAYGIYPMLFYQASSVSDILGCECFYPLRQNVDQVLGK